MVLRIATFLCLVALVASQTTMEATTMEATTMEATTMEATTMEATTMEPDVPTTDDPAAPTTDALEDLDDRYETYQAVMMRARHFYCLGVNETTFPNDIMNLDSTVEPRRWALFLQYPILNYLDTLGKESLLRVAAQLVQDGGLTAFNETDFCIANIVQYGVSSYRESVLINFYFKGDLVINDGNSDGISITDFNAAFTTGYMAAVASPAGPSVQRAFGRRAFVIDLPGHVADIKEGSDDPTQRAVFLGSYIGNTDIEAALRGRQQDFADNPNPINFGLEAGDIIFAVFGSIFLIIVGGLAVLGFVIHPFFLA